MNLVARLMGIFRNGLAQPEPTLREALAPANNTHAGVSVTPTSAMQSAAVYACVRVLSETIASLPLLVYRRLEPRGKERAPDHPLYAVLHDAANEEMAAMQWRETMMVHLLLWGNSYSEIERDAAGRVVALWPLLPNLMQVDRDPDQRLRYTYTLPDGGGQKVLPRERVFHVPGLGYDGLIGYSPIAMARQAIGLSLAAEEFGARLFGDGTNVGGVVEHPGRLTREAHDSLRADLSNKYSGLGKSHRIMLLEEGMKFTKVGIPPEEAQFLETRKFQVSEIARIFRVPPHLIGDLDRATFSNIEHQSIEFVVHTVRPWLVRIEQAIALQLMTPRERQRYFAEHLVDGLLRGDIKNRYDAYAVARQNGWMSANEIRERENLNPVKGGDRLLINGNMIPVEQAGTSAGGEGSSEG